jgi:fructose-1-phosphate kinase PfkB-like protein
LHENTNPQRILNFADADLIAGLVQGQNTDGSRNSLKEEEMANVLVVGMNPAWQITLEFAQFHWGQLNRAESRHEFVAGKGQNVAKVLSRFGHQAWLLQVIGGANGQRVEEWLCREGVHLLNVRVAAETRVCSTIIEKASGQVTELVEPFLVGPEEDAMRRALELVPSNSGSFDAVIYCGTMPDGMNPLLYLEIERRVDPAFSVLDSFHKISRELLGAVSCLKINVQEYEELEKSDPGWAGRLDRMPAILLTDGPRAARLMADEGGERKEWRFPLPRLENLQNPIGAGDTVTAAFAHFVLSGTPVPEAFRQALAVGSASCLTLVPGEYREEDRRRILEEIRLLY